jgi:hypothetical protein
LRRRKPSSLHLSKTSSAAVSTAPTEFLPPPVIGSTIRYAETDDDVIAMHRFLLIVAQPAMRCPANPEKSLMEIIRVTKYEAALMAIHNGLLVGTMGIIKPDWWYGDGEFLTDRWHFVLPEFMHHQVATDLFSEALKIADGAGLEFIHQGKIRGAKKGALRMAPRVYTPSED